MNQCPHKEICLVLKRHPDRCIATENRNPCACIHYWTIKQAKEKANEKK